MSLHSFNMALLSLWKVLSFDSQDCMWIPCFYFELILDGEVSTQLHLYSHTGIGLAGSTVAISWIISFSPLLSHRRWRDTGEILPQSAKPSPTLTFNPGLYIPVIRSLEELVCTLLFPLSPNPGTLRERHLIYGLQQLTIRGFEVLLNSVVTSWLHRVQAGEESWAE